MLDFARIFPPEVFSNVQQGDDRKFWLTRLLRREFISSYKLPLSSDAGSPFVHQAIDRMERQSEVIAATNELHRTHVHSFSPF